MPLPTLQTARLELRQLSLADAPALHEAMRDRLAMAYWYQPPHESLEATRTTVWEMTRSGPNYWSIRLRDAERCLGFVGFVGSQPPQGFAYFLHREFWRRGLMKEAAREALDFGFARLALAQAEAWIDDANLPSLALARALGFRPVGELAVRRPHQPNPRRMLVCGLWAHHFHGGPPGWGNRPDAVCVIPELAVNDVSRSIRFYTEKLGFRLAFSLGDPVRYAAVTLSAWSGSPGEIRLTKAAQPVVPTTRVTFKVDNVDLFHARYAEKGVQPAAIEVMPWNEREFIVRDSDGYPLRFTSL